MSKKAQVETEEGVSERKVQLGVGVGEILVGGALAVTIVLLTPIWELLELFAAIVLLPLSLFLGMFMVGDGGRRLGKDAATQMVKKIKEVREDMENTEEIKFNARVN